MRKEGFRNTYESLPLTSHWLHVFSSIEHSISRISEYHAKGDFIMRGFWRIFLLILCLSVAAPSWAQDAENGWPKEIITEKGTAVLYQPEPEKLDGDKLDVRMAVALEKKGKEPIFGAVWLTATLETDREERMALVTGIKVNEMRFAELPAEKEKQFTEYLEREIPTWELKISLDRLISTLELIEEREQASQNLSTAPPAIIFLPEPAILVSIDGDPQLQDLQGDGLQRVVNTPFTLLFSAKDKRYYLYAAKAMWYTAAKLNGDWAVAKDVPKDVAAHAPKETQAQTDEDKTSSSESGPPPRILVATTPTELISSNGAPEYSAIKGTALQYMSNSDSDVLLYKEKEYFVLLAGRWYSSDNLEKGWEFVPGEKLPKDFAKIPEDSEMGTVLYAVPGTEVAKDAVLDAQIPQTAAIDPKKAQLAVEYDGDPQFKSIDKTEMTYAVNTATPVIKAEGKYYACDEGVWFVADSPKGAWRVATKIPVVIYSIPPECPLYYVTFVRIYKATPEVVYVGYTPGYTGTYVYHTTVVYGTGYYYPGWVGHYYYPRHCTWGFHVRWSPWYGWSFGFSYGWGPFHFGVGYGGWYRGGWWGPRPYHGYRNGYRHGHRDGFRAGYRAGQRDARRSNLYRSRRNQVRVKPGLGVAQPRVKAPKVRTAKDRKNNVFVDKAGNIHRKTDKGWQERTKSGWKDMDSPAQDKLKDKAVSKKPQPGKDAKDRVKDKAQQKPVKKPERKPEKKPEAVKQTPKKQIKKENVTKPKTKQRPAVKKQQKSRAQQLDRSKRARDRGDSRARSFNKSRSAKPKRRQ